MKRTLITFALLVGRLSGFGQPIDTAALHLMQKSWEKLAAMENISYRMTKVDTMIRETQFTVNWIRMNGMIRIWKNTHIIWIKNGIEIPHPQCKLV